MIERLLENWLSRANERSFQIPFCHWLAYSGHTVVHLSRHCAMEIGKDILTIALDGVPCAYQLKGVEGGGKITQTKWRNDLYPQVMSLVLGSIAHPSIPGGRPHRAYLVINGELEEEVCREINDFNQGLADSGLDRKLNVILRGELFQCFKELQSDFWATNLSDLKTYLELYLEDGRGQLPKEKIATLLESSLPLDTHDGKAPGGRESARAIAGSAIICASAISAFTNSQNHLAEFEAWTLFWGYVLAVAERWDLPLKLVQFAIDVALEAMYSALARLCDELMERQNYIEGNILTDKMIYNVRITHLLGLMGIYGLWSARRIREGVEQEDADRRDFLRRFCRDRVGSLWLWGEYAIPQFLAYNFFFRTFDPSPHSDLLYHTLMNAIVKLNGEGRGGLANPYYDAESILPRVFGLERDDLQDSFRGSSYYLESLLHLLVKSNLKQHARYIMPSVTRIGLRHYTPDEPWRYYFFRDRSGKSYLRFMRLPPSWSALRALSEDDCGEEIPKYIKHYPIAYLCFLCVLPHRVNASGIRWLSNRLLEGG